MTGPCGAIYVELGEHPDRDTLQRCTADPCHHHPIQLDWIRANPERLARYNNQLRRYDLGQHIGSLAGQASLI